MSKRLYVGNLAYQVTSDDLQNLFEAHGEVRSAAVVTDRETNRSRGFGFVEIAFESDADTAVEALDGQDHMGRRLNVYEANPRNEGGPGRGAPGARRS